MKTYTVNDVMAVRPCPEYPHKRVEELWAGRHALSAEEIVGLPISIYDVFWIIKMLKLTSDGLKTANGTIIYAKDGLKHREGDEPAIIYPDGTVEFWIHDELHRDGDEPAEIYADGTVRYFKRGKQHREGDEPAEIWPDGTVEFWINGKFIRKKN